MKKIFSFFAAILFAGSMMADTYSVTIDQNAGGSNNVHITTTTANSSQDVSYENVSWVAEWTGEGVPTSGSKIQCQFGTGSKLCSTVQFSTSDINGDITSVKVTTWGAKSTGAKCSVKVGATDFKKDVETSVSLSNTVSEEHEFTGSASGAIVIAWEQTTAKAIYVSKIEVTYTPDPNAVAKPVFDPEETSFEDNLNVKLTCATTGATIYYTLDETEPSASSTPYTDAGIDIDKTTTINAIAIKGEGKSPIATNTYTPQEKLTCAQFSALSNSTTINHLLNEVVVTFVDGEGKNIWVKDASGALLLYYKDGNYGLKVGDVVNKLKGTKTTYQTKVAEMVPTRTISELSVVSGEAPAPEVMANAPTVDDINKYVVFKGISVEGEFVSGTASNITINVAGTDVTFRSNFKNAYTFVAGKKYDIVGIVSYYNSAIQVNFVSATESTPTAIDNTEAGVKANKVLRDGVLLIEKNGVLYNAQGAVVR